jgi:biopolymer transport protein ExbD
MGGAIGGPRKGSVDVELNVVPFIDLMSCLTAFLLVTAVWSNYAQIKVKPKGLGREAEDVLQEEEPVTASILLTENEIWAGLSIGDRRQIRDTGDQHDWTGLGEVLAEFKEMPSFADRADIEVAAEDGVTYQAVITTMDTAVQAGFNDIGFVDVPSLTVKFKE